MQTSETALFKNAAARCAVRECCRADFEKKWRAQGVPADEMEATLRQLEKEGFIDEGRYAKAFTNDKLRYDRWGRLKIRAALMMKNISADDIKAALDTIDEEEYQAALRHVLHTKQKSISAAGTHELRMKLARFAASRGFEAHLVFRALDMEEAESF